MGSSVKVGGAWRSTVMPHAKVAGTWKPVRAAYTKVGGTWRNWFLQGGINDASFATYDIANKSNSTINAIAVQSDGKIVVGGVFTAWNGVTVNRLLRLNADGTLDTAFTTNTGTGPSSTVSAIAVQSNGQILVGGQFSAWNGTTVGRIARLNANGTLDTTFNTNIGTAANNNVNAIALQSDGKILVGGQFTTWNGTTVGYIVRLNADGTRDTVFTTNNGTGANSTIYDIATQSDGKIVIVGAFFRWNNATVNNAFYEARLNSDGTVDSVFTTVNNGPNGVISKLAIQSNGQIIIGGNFTSYTAVGVVTTNRLARINSNNQLDTAFTTNNGTGANSNVTAIAIQSDGKILVGGVFTTWNGVTVNRIVRLNFDGTRDTTFTTNAGTGVESTVNAIAKQSDGKIIMGGAFTAWNGTAVGRIVRLNTDGTRDTASLLGKDSQSANNNINAVVVQSDGKILLSGAFTTWNGTTVGRIVRLNADGTRDTVFTTNNGTGSDVTLTSVAVQSDGKIVVAGNLTVWNGATGSKITRLNSDGTLDTAFNTNIGTILSAGAVNAIAVQPDGKIVVGGAFTSWQAVTRNRLLRLNADGTLDTTFNTNIGTASNNTVSAIKLQSDGKILVGGAFTTWNGTTVGRIVRLNADGTLDTAFSTNIGTGGIVTAIAIQSDGKILVGGSFNTWNGTTAGRIVRLNADGTLDTAFSTNTGTGASSTVFVVAVQSNGQILVGGQFATWNGTTVNYIVRLNADGTGDTAFTTNTGTGATNTVNTIAVQSSGHILVGGNFIGFNQINRSYIARIGGELAQ